MAHKILVVDDEQDTLILLEMTLQLAGYEVAKAHTGQMAIQLLSEFNPDVVILDVMMPGESGLDILNIIKKDFENPPPVVMFSARGRIEDMVEGMEAGAYKYLVKPISREKLLETVKSALTTRVGAPRRK
ncbi:MAG: response regulator [Chloroflexi bacterium]|nr:response regulator [Chloroflexota bacterium]